MCTVTFIPQSSNGFILSSNRDEAPGRNTLTPQIYRVNETELIFPKDEVAGGTWIGVSEKQRLICLLNGGFTAHQRKDTYRMSRGVIVTDLLTANNAQQKIKSFNFQGIEPFTIILLDWSRDLRINELVWDGSQVHYAEKPLAPQIWSSSLLYSEEVKKKRESWFSEFLLDHMSPSEEEILHFHKTAGDGNIESDVIMDRGFVKTKSISVISKIGREGTFRYEDLQLGEVTQLSF